MMAFTLNGFLKSPKSLCYYYVVLAPPPPRPIAPPRARIAEVLQTLACPPRFTTTKTVSKYFFFLEIAYREVLCVFLLVPIALP